MVREAFFWAVPLIFFEEAVTLFTVTFARLETLVLQPLTLISAGAAGLLSLFLLTLLTVELRREIPYCLLPVMVLLLISVILDLFFTMIPQCLLFLMVALRIVAEALSTMIP